MGSTSLKGWVEVLGAVAVAVLLTLVPIALGTYQITLAVLPLVYFGLRRGLLQGLVASALTALIVFLINLGQADVFSGLVSEAGPYAFIGISGLFAKNTQRTLNNKRFSNAALNIVTASVIGTLLSVIWVVLQSQNLVTDAISGALTAAVIAIVLLIVAKFAPKSFIPKDTPYLSRKEKSKLLND